jgi:hypothetical protein
MWRAIAFAIDGFLKSVRALLCQHSLRQQNGVNFMGCVLSATRMNMAYGISIALTETPPWISKQC